MRLSQRFFGQLSIALQPEWHRELAAATLPNSGRSRTFPACLWKACIRLWNPVRGWHHATRGMYVGSTGCLTPREGPVPTGQHNHLSGDGAGDRGGDGRATMPLDVTDRLSAFDRFATRASAFVSRAWFFVLCLLLVLLWAPSILLFGNVDTWQLIINTVTTIVTFLLVALLQNTQKRADDAVQHKLNAIADALSDLMAEMADDHPGLHRDQDELRAAVGLEDRESTG